MPSAGISARALPRALAEAPEARRHADLAAAGVNQGAPHGLSPPCPVVTAVLERGVAEQFFLFPDNAPPRRVQRWKAPSLETEAEHHAVNSRLAALGRALAPAGRGELLARVLTLLSHYRMEAHPAAVEMRIAEDWAEDLGPYPMWAIEEAARVWRRTKRFKPQISEIVELCERATGELRLEWDRLQQAIERAHAAGNPLARKAELLARGLARRMAAGAGT